MSDEQLMIGDDALHGERAYAFVSDVVPRSLLTGDIGRRPINGDGEMGIIEGTAVESAKAQEAQEAQKRE